MSLVIETKRDKVVVVTEIYYEVKMIENILQIVAHREIAGVWKYGTKRLFSGKRDMPGKMGWVSKTEVIP